MRDELRELKAEVIEYLVEQGEQIIDDPEERSHQGNNTPPAPEMSRDDKLRAGLKASKRSYQNGMVVVNGQNNLGHYMRQLVRMRRRPKHGNAESFRPQVIISASGILLDDKDKE
jgi:hypothetical protein